MNWNYFFKNYFGTLLLGPIILYIEFVEYNEVQELIIKMIQFYPICIIYSLFFSMPTYVLYAILNKYLQPKNTNFLLLKTLLIAFTTVGIIITTTLIKGTMMESITVSYIIATIITGIFFKIEYIKK